MSGFASLGWWLLLLAGAAMPMAAQTQGSAGPDVVLRETYPNPFFPSTTIPFVIEPDVCRNGYRPVVTVRIYSVIVEVVATPVLAAGSTRKVAGIRLPCGTYEAFWDGKYDDGERSVTPGVYYTELTVDGRRFTQKMIAQRRPNGDVGSIEEGRP